MTTPTDECLEVANGSGSEVNIFIKPSTPDEFTRVAPWTDDGEKTWYAKHDGTTLVWLRIRDTFSGYVPGAPIEGRTIKLLGGVHVNHDTLIRLEYQGRVGVTCDQLSSLEEGNEKKIVDVVSKKSVICTVVFVYEKQTTENIPDWSPIDSLPGSSWILV